MRAFCPVAAPDPAPGLEATLVGWMPSTGIWCLGADDSGDPVEAAKRFVDDHLAEPFDVGDLSREAGLSRSHFTRLFRDREGVSPWDYVLTRRVHRARELLEQGTGPSDAALESGFYDQSHLTRIFRRVTGTTPGRYRRQGTIVQDDRPEPR